MKKLKGNIRILNETVYHLHLQVDKKELVDSLFIKYSFNNWKGNLIEENFDNLDGAGRDIAYKYNDNGNVIEECIYTDNGKFESKSRYNYDINGKIIEKCNYEARNTLKDVVKFKCDDKGNVIEESFDNVKGKGRKIAYRYNGNGDLVERIDYGDVGTLIFRTIFLYDESGNIREENRYDFYERCVSRSQYIHNNNGNIVMEYIYADNGKDISKDTYRFGEFDKFGNWAMKVRYVGEEPIIITKRIIAYY